jgi:3-oxoacyl-(acyl-carrier-protein) synthase
MYIRDLLCISPQPTYQADFFSQSLIQHTGIQFNATEASCNDMIPAGVLRRMSKITRMGVGTAMPLLNKHKDIEGIIIGSAYGGVNDSMKFLEQIEQYNEGTLTPTSFVQSTPNSLAGILSVMSQCNGYNNTHVHEGLAFENALIDAKMYLETNKGTLLAGAAEEISEWNNNLNRLKGLYKATPIESGIIIRSGTSGTYPGEGAAMFVISSKEDQAKAKITDIRQMMTENLEDVTELIGQMLEQNNIKTDQVSMVISGMNGDNRTDNDCYEISNSVFPHSGISVFKHCTGEYPAASSFALWLATHIITGQQIHNEMMIKPTTEKPIHILIHNSYHPGMHGLILVSKS